MSPAWFPLVAVNVAVFVAPAGMASVAGLILPAGAKLQVVACQLIVPFVPWFPPLFFTVKKTAVHVPGFGFVTWMSAKSARPCGSE